jgi:hypothetical protein
MCARRYHGAPERKRIPNPGLTSKTITNSSNQNEMQHAKENTMFINTTQLHYHRKIPGTEISVDYRHFELPQRLMKDKRLTRLSVDAIRMYLFIASKNYDGDVRTRVYDNVEFLKNLDIPKHKVKDYLHELRAVELIKFNHTQSNQVTVELVQDEKLVDWTLHKEQST